MNRPILAALLLFLPALALAESPGDASWKGVCSVSRMRLVYLERMGTKADIAKAKAIARLIAHMEKPRETLRDDLKLAFRVSKALRTKRLAGENGIAAQFDHAVDGLDGFVRECDEDAGCWCESLPPSRPRDRAFTRIAKARQLRVDSASAERHDRVRLLRRARTKLARAEKRLAALGPRPEPVPFIRNPGFELGTGNAPDDWTFWGAPYKIVWESGEDRCVSLGSDAPATQNVWSQTVRNCIPGRAYNVTVRVRAENIVVDVPEPGKTWGAYIGIKRQWGPCSDPGAAYQGTFDWKEVSFTFRAVEERETIELRLGRSGKKVSGRAWFDDVRISSDDWMPGPPQGRHVRLILEAEDVATAGLDEAGLQSWIRNLDLVYDLYEDLVGDVPYEGAKIDILSVRQYPGGWAVAGNPIRWQRRYVPRVLERYRTLGDWSFGILHEIGHDFDLDYRWVWNAEVQANLKMVYALEKLGGSVSQRGVLYTSGDIRNFYEIAFNEAKAAGEVTSWGGWLYRMVCIKDEIGWEPFRKMYRSYPTGIPTRLERFEKYFDELERHSGADIRGTLIPVDELAWVRDQLN